MADQAKSISDPLALRAMAHPVRLRILEELERAGALRAADLAATLGIPANQASFHLRQLAKYEFIEEAPEAARDGRDRAWKAVSQSLHVDSPALMGTSAGRAAVAVLRRSMAEQIQLMVDRSLASKPGEGHGHFTQTWATLRLSDDEATLLRDDLGEVIERWTKRSQEAEAPDARVYALVQILQPLDPPGDEG